MRCAASLPAARAHAESHPRDEFLNPLVLGAERVLAQDRALCLVIQLQVNPVHGEVPALLLRPPDELTPQACPGRLRSHRLCFENVDIPRDALDRAAALQQVEQATAAV